MSRILLVSSNRSQRPYPVPPLGVCLLAERLAPRHEVVVFDAMFRDPAELRETIRSFGPDVVGLGIRNIDDMALHDPHSFIDEVRDDFVRLIRETTGAPLLVGGAGFSILPGPILRSLGADHGVAGEGEATFERLVESITRGGDGRDVPGVIHPGGEAPLPGAGHLDSEDLCPSRIDRWLDFGPYRARGSYPVQTKRGCAHRCVYCTYPTIEGRAWRLRRPTSVAREIAEAADRLGPVTFEFVDSTFNDPPGHAEAVCRELIDRGVAVRLRTMGINPRGISAELLDLMKRAGFAQMDCTPDSAAPTVIERLDKGFTRDDLERAATAIGRSGIPCMWFFLIGGPGETEDTFADTLDFIDRFVSPDDMVYMAAGLRIYPDTPLHPIARLAGMVDPDDDLLRPRFYIAPALDAGRCIELVEAACAVRANCVPAWETAPSPEMVRRALAIRDRLGPDVPMFRALIRVRREMLGL
jgi:radical SAM superfamily enzyme YgiQ (UPF0313 family)